MRQTVAILGTPVDFLDMSQTLARLEQFIQERSFHQVATANTDFLVNAMSDPELQHILRQADLVELEGQCRPDALCVGDIFKARHQSIR